MRLKAEDVTQAQRFAREPVEPVEPPSKWDTLDELDHNADDFAEDEEAEHDG